MRTLLLPKIQSDIPKADVTTIIFRNGLKEFFTFDIISLCTTKQISIL